MICAYSQAQTTPIGANNNTIEVKGGIKADSAFKLPIIPLTVRYVKGIDTNGLMFVCVADSLPRYMKQGKIVKLISEFDSIVYYATPHYVDSVAIKYGKYTITGTGAQSFIVKADYWLLGIAVNPVSSENIKIGLTPGGEEILTSTPFTSGIYTNLQGIEYYFSATLPTTLYFSGASGGVIYKILEQ